MCEKTREGVFLGCTIDYQIQIEPQDFLLTLLPYLNAGGSGATE